MKFSDIWNSDDFVNAILFASVVFIVWWTFHPYFDHNFWYYPIQNQPYGSLWWILNPLFQNWQLYRVQVTAIQLPVLAIQWWLVRKKILSKELVVMCMFQTMLFRWWSVDQNVTVVMFAPFVELTPLATLFFIFQKAGLGWSFDLNDIHWHNFMAQFRDLGEPGHFVAPYIFLIIWIFFPLVFWWKNRRNDIVWKMLKSWRKKKCEHCFHWHYEHAWCCKCEDRKKELDEWWEKLKRESAT